MARYVITPQNTIRYYKTVKAARKAGYTTWYIDRKAAEEALQPHDRTIYHVTFDNGGETPEIFFDGYFEDEISADAFADTLESKWGQPAYVTTVDIPYLDDLPTSFITVRDGSGKYHTFPDTDFRYDDIMDLLV